MTSGPAPQKKRNWTASKEQGKKEEKADRKEEDVLIDRTGAGTLGLAERKKIKTETKKQVTRWERHKQKNKPPTQQKKKEEEPVFCDASLWTSIQ